VFKSRSNSSILLISLPDFFYLWFGSAASYVYQLQRSRPSGAGVPICRLGCPSSDSTGSGRVWPSASTAAILADLLREENDAIQSIPEPAARGAPDPARGRAVVSPVPKPPARPPDEVPWPKPPPPPPRPPAPSPAARVAVGVDELHAFVDGQLPAARRREVVAYLDVHPDAADRVAAYHRQRDALALLGRHLAEVPGPARLAGSEAALLDAMRRGDGAPGWLSSPRRPWRPSSAGAAG